VGVRLSALLLVLSLVSPAVVNTVCELACLHAHHHRTGEALAAQCHGDDASPAPVVAMSSAEVALCHGDGPVPSAIVKATPHVASMPAVVGSTRLPEFHVPAQSPVRGRLWVGPPDLLLITTQLRI
jgi:hypothetical protein